MRSMARNVLTDNHLKAIGLVAAEWSWTEMCLENLIWEIAEINHYKGYAITTHLPSETRINILSALAHIGLANAALQKELNAIVARIRQLRTERNNIVHAIWLSSKPRESLGLITGAMGKRRKPVPALFKITAKGKIIMTSKPLTAKQIFTVGAEIAQLVTEMYDLLERIQLHRKESTPSAT